MPKAMDGDNFRRTLAGLCLIAAPLVLLVAMLVDGGGGNAGLVRSMAESPGRVQAANLLIMFSSVLFVPALVGLLGLVRGKGVVLAHIGVALALIGVVGHAVWAGFQIVLLGLVQSGTMDHAQISELISGGPPNAGFVIVMLAFMIGFFVDLLFVAGGLWRSGAVPRWAVVCILFVPFADFVSGGAIREIAAQYTRNGLRVSVEAPEKLPLLPAAVEVAAYRIAQEALTNVARHATASACVVRIALDKAAGALRLEIRDDGDGISPGRTRGVGLSSMRERAGELGGGFVVLSLKTVRNYVSNIFTKLQVADRAQAIIRAREAGLGYDG